MMKFFCLIVFPLALFAQSPPTPPGFDAAVVITNTSSFAVAITPTPTNQLPFKLITRESNGWTLLSIVTTTNLLRCHVVMSTNVNFSVTNAELSVAFSGWPQTQHVPGFAVNDGISHFGPPPLMYYKVILIK